MADAVSVRPALLLALVRRPLWLLGMACDVIGIGLQAVALERGSLVVVEPVVATSLVFSLLVLGAMTHVRFSAREIGSAVVVIGGLAGFLLSASPTTTSTAVASARGWGDVRRDRVRRSRRHLRVGDGTAGAGARRRARCLRRARRRLPGRRQQGVRRPAR
jgi:hypothetical protein